MKEVNEWLSDKNRHPPRWQTIAKSYEVEKFIRKAIACNMIRPSDAPAWSQILLTPKKNGSYRFCVDFRALNNATHSSGWPLPNIKHVLDRLAKKRPKYFTVLDLTSGYFQIPIDEASRKLTAFRTAKGLFEWLRLPMGLKGAGSYFQMQMQCTCNANRHTDETANVTTSVNATTQCKHTCNALGVQGNRQCECTCK